jgi:phosphatidate cytidylyltransferase
MRSRYGPTPGVENFNARTGAWWVMVIVLGIALVIGKSGTVALFGVLSAIALSEFLVLTQARHADRYAVVLCFTLFLPLQYAFVWTEWYGMFTILIPVYAFLLLPITQAVSGDIEHFMSRAAHVQWGLMLAVFCLSHVPALTTLAIPGYAGKSILLALFLIIVVEASDVFQYVWGKLLGRHKIAPRLSPSKTWEGLLGGIASASLIGVALSWMTPFTIAQAALVSLLITTMGFFGGLVMSAMKRDRGVKDWGRLIPGHGGVLDRVDSILFAAPVYFHVIRYVWSN